jgi:hypothetical protein
VWCVCGVGVSVVCGVCVGQDADLIPSRKCRVKNNNLVDYASTRVG